MKFLDYLKKNERTSNLSWRRNVIFRMQRRIQMPVEYLDLPSGLAADVKKKLVKEVADSIHHAYMIPDTRVLLREWPAEQTSVDGELARPMRPICNFCDPPGLAHEAQRHLV